VVHLTPTPSPGDWTPTASWASASGGCGGGGAASGAAGLCTSGGVAPSEEREAGALVLLDAPGRRRPKRNVPRGVRNDTSFCSRGHPHTR